MLLNTLLTVSLALALPSIFANPILHERQTPLTQYIIYNQCPADINLYIGGQLDGPIARGGNTTKFLPANAGFFYTDANGGTASGTRTLRAGFFGEQYYYYMVKDPAYVNTALSVAPQGRPSRMGFCASPECDGVNCDTAFSTPPTRFPPSGSTAPNPPLYQCPFANTTYVIRFCPNGVWSGPRPWRIHPGIDHPEKCLDVQGAVFANGTPVQIYDCNGTPAQDWFLNRGSTKVQLAGTNFCLDAGSTPGNGVGMKIWQCYDNLPAQQWYYTDDNRIALENQGLCLDLTDGNLSNWNRVQTWQCTDNNNNQVWTL